MFAEDMGLHEPLILTLSLSLTLTLTLTNPNPDPDPNPDPNQDMGLNEMIKFETFVTRMVGVRVRARIRVS